MQDVQASTAMKFKSLFLLLIVCSWSCRESPAPKAALQPVQQAAVPTGTSYFFLPGQSTIKWTATHTGGLSPRYGTIDILKGEVKVQEGRLTGGVVEIDMHTLVVDAASITEQDKQAIDLQNQLKSDAFFDVGRYPVAQFVLTQVDYMDTGKAGQVLLAGSHQLSGNLTIKDHTWNITFPAQVYMSDSVLSLKAHFVLDRGSWGLTFGSAGNPADLGVSKEFEISLDLKGGAL